MGSSISVGNDIYSGWLGVISGICCISLTLSTSKLLAEFMIPTSGGSGFTSKAYYASNIVSRIRRK